MLEIVLTREDANTEFALLAEWLVEDQSEVAQGQPVCVVETTKATVEIEAPGDGTLVQLYDDGIEVELGKTIALVAESADELADALSRREPKPAAEPKPADRKATMKAIEAGEAPAATGGGRGGRGGTPPPAGGRGRGGLEQAQTEMPVAPTAGCPNTTAARGRQIDCHPSPDGKLKAFYRNRNLWIANFDGSGE